MFHLIVILGLILDYIEDYTPKVESDSNYFVSKVVSQHNILTYCK